jgi:hypothetical protein
MRELYLQQKGIEEKANLNQTTSLEERIKEYANIDIDLTGISKKQCSYLNAMFFQKNWEAIKNFIK